MRVKNDNVSFQSLAPQLVLALWMVDEVYKRYDRELVVTSANDSAHSRTSLHYSGNAADVRLVDPHTKRRFFDDEAKVVREIKAKLNRDFDVVLENDHIHLEYQPKAR